MKTRLPISQYISRNSDKTVMNTLNELYGTESCKPFKEVFIAKTLVGLEYAISHYVFDFDVDFTAVNIEKREDHANVIVIDYVYGKESKRQKIYVTFSPEIHNNQLYVFFKTVTESHHDYGTDKQSVSARLEKTVDMSIIEIKLLQDEIVSVNNELMSSLLSDEQTDDRLIKINMLNMRLNRIYSCISERVNAISTTQFKHKLEKIFPSCQL